MPSNGDCAVKPAGRLLKYFKLPFPQRTIPYLQYSIFSVDLSATSSPSLDPFQAVYHSTAEWTALTRLIHQETLFRTTVLVRDQGQEIHRGVLSCMTLGSL